MQLSGLSPAVTDMGLLRRKKPRMQEGPIDPVRAEMVESLTSDLQHLVKELQALTAPYVQRPPEGPKPWKS